MVQYSTNFDFSYYLVFCFLFFFFASGSFASGGREGGSAQYRNDVRTLASRRPVSAACGKPPSVPVGVYGQAQHPRGSDLALALAFKSSQALWKEKKRPSLSVLGIGEQATGN
jgi:hypothetical protein